MTVLRRFQYSPDFFRVQGIVSTPFGPTHSPIKQVPGALLPRVMLLVLEIDQVPPCSAEVKTDWRYTSTVHVLVA